MTFFLKKKGQKVQEAGDLEVGQLLEDKSGGAGGEYD